MKETYLKNRVLTMLRTEYKDIWLYKAADRYTSGIPDILGCLNGRMFAIELKVLPNKVTHLQEHVIANIRAAGGIAGVCYNCNDVRKLLERR